MKVEDYKNLPERIFCSSWVSLWKPSEELRAQFPPRHSDFRDRSPPDLPSVYAAHQDLIRDGRWTFGLWDCWCPRAKMVKHATHLPCWDSYRVNPCRWRGIVFGRTMNECYWDGLRQMRWARTMYAANLGREYILPVRGVGRHSYKSEIKALCWMYFLMGCVFSCGIGQVFSLCGNVCFNFSALYSCHAREKMRRRYKLPPALGLPPGVDDFLVHFFCLYCAVYQEMRELSIRGVDGPGMHILDVLPDSYAAAPGGKEAIAKRQAAVARMMGKPPAMFVSRPNRRFKEGEETATAAVGVNFQDVKEGTAAALQRATGTLRKLRSDEKKGGKGDASGSDDDGDGALFGWCSHCVTVPVVQEMSRGDDHDGNVRSLRTQSLPDMSSSGCQLDDGERRVAVLGRSWSIVY